MRSKSSMFCRIILMILSLISLSLVVLNVGAPQDDLNILVIDGHGKSVHLLNIDGWDLVILQNAPDTIIENLTYIDGSTIFVLRSDNLIVRNNYIKNANSYALFVELSENVQIYNNTIESGTNDGIISYLNDNVIIDDNRVSGVVKNGIFVRGNNVTISNNRINDITGTGIFIEGSTDLVVENNSINNVDWTPIAPDQTSFDSGIFSGNTYNGNLLSANDINPAISNTISNEETKITSGLSNEKSQSTDLFSNTKENDNSSVDETYSPFLIMAFGIFLASFFYNSKKQNL